MFQFVEFSLAQYHIKPNILFKKEKQINIYTQVFLQLTH